MDRPDFPPAAADRVFAQLLAMFGAQRMAVAWGDVPAADRRAVWATAIGRAVWNDARRGYDLDAVRDALAELASTATKGPPSCGEFADLCARMAQRPGRNVRALPWPNRTEADLERGREHLANLRGILGRSTQRRAEQRAAAAPELAPIALPACTCRRGRLVVDDREACPACGTFAANRARAGALRQPQAEADA